MRNRIFIIFLSIFLVLSCSTDTDTETSRESIGTIINVRIVDIGWGGFTQIHTERMSVVVRGLPAVRIGSEAFKVTMASGKEYIVWSGNKKGYLIRGTG